MTRATRRSGLALILLGVAGAVFFWLTDPRYGPDVNRQPAVVWKPLWRVFRTEVSVDPRHWLYVLRGSPGNVVDAANAARVSTIVGFAGCVVVLGIGLWLLTRRTV